MSYTFQPGERYRMPTHFGPATGPRRGPDGVRFDCKDSPTTTAIAVHFATDAEVLDRFLPPGFELDGEPVVTVTATYMKNIAWLAGRGYNMLGVSFPAAHCGQRRTPGQFLVVLWENMADPIITGREELGYAKVFCELPTPTETKGVLHCTANWMGFPFVDMEVGPFDAVEPPQPTPIHGEGLLHYKYVPRTGVPGECDAAYAVLTPAATPNRVIHTMHRGQGRVTFHAARWKDMPTQYTIVNALAAMPVRESRGATVTCSVGGKDVSDARILS